jgi:hypothetical protein
MRGELAGSELMSTAVHRSPHKFWRSTYIFNRWSNTINFDFFGEIIYILDYFLLLGLGLVSSLDFVIHTGSKTTP